MTDIRLSQLVLKTLSENPKLALSQLGIKIVTEGAETGVALSQLVLKIVVDNDIITAAPASSASSVISGTISLGALTLSGLIVSSASATFRFSPTPLTPSKRIEVMRLVEVDYSLPGIYKFKAVRENQRIYTGVAPPGVGFSGGGPIQSIALIGQTALLLMDTTLFRDADDAMGAGFYVAATPASGNPASWKGASVFVSTDGGTTFQNLITLTSPAIMGVAETALPSVADWAVPDNSSTVDIRLFGNGMLSSFSLLDAQNLLSGILLGDEVLCYTTATFLSSNPNRYRLEGGLIRARRGTDWAVGTHQANERFLLLQPGPIQRVNGTLSELNIQKLYRSDSIGGVLGPSPVQPFTNAGIGLKPYSPVNLISTGSPDKVITWDRRSRIAGNWNLSTPPPLGETTEAYEVEIWDTGFTTLKRTVTAITSPTTTYTGAQQTTDFGSPQALVGVKVFQISAAVGRGFPAVKVI